MSMKMPNSLFPEVVFSICHKDVNQIASMMKDYFTKTVNQWQHSTSSNKIYQSATSEGNKETDDANGWQH
jgi:hypothetical protein